MKKFLDEDFLLQNDTAAQLYHEFAKQMPVIDYHCHLDPNLIAADHQFENLTQAWLQGDHYKWRALRANGIEERYITGDATDLEKFEKWAETVPYTLRNPLYHWTHLELKRYFDIEELLNPESAEKIYRYASDLLQSDDYSVRRLLEKMNVQIVCTTDDPVDSLEAHRKIAESGWNIKVLPAWRPDKAIALENNQAWNQYMDRLAGVSGIATDTFAGLMDALFNRHEYFHSRGCRVSDHGLDTFYAEPYTDSEIKQIYDTARSGKNLSIDDIRKFKSALLYEFAVMDAGKSWVQQYHVGPMRNNNRRMMNLIGPDTGYDSIGDEPVAKPMSAFFDRLESEGRLTKTILYNLNPRDNEVYATMTGNFQDGSVPGKMQWGSGWWFLDQKDGMENQLNTLSRLGLLSRFVGMLTDSRSFLSFPRHEYFRRILCNLVGQDVENGELPGDMNLLGGMIRDICYYNARNYFGFPTGLSPND
jgi:glucuronate isomerase